MPQSDGSAYDGNLIVKRTTYGKSNRGSKAVEVDRVKRAINILEKEIFNLSTINSIDLNGPISVENQIFANKQASASINKAVLMMKTFVANNQQTVDNE